VLQVIAKSDEQCDLEARVAALEADTNTSIAARAP
jgi:hypothetical protein